MEGIMCSFPSRCMKRKVASPTARSQILTCYITRPLCFVSETGSFIFKISILSSAEFLVLKLHMASSKIRSSCSFPNILLSCLNFTLFILASVSTAPIILLKFPPTPLGLAILVVSCISLFSSFVGFYSQLTHFCFITHLSLLIASLVGQVLSMLALFTRENSSLSMLKSPRDPKEAKFLARLECGILMAMIPMQLAVLVLSCAVHNCWVREYEGLEAEKEATAKKRSRRMARVQEESIANAAKIADVKAKEFDGNGKMNNKYGQWVKTDFEG